MAQTFQNSPFEDPAEIGLGVVFGVCVFGSLMPRLFKCCRKLAPSKINKSEYFDKGECSTGLKSYTLFNQYPKISMVTLILFPILIVGVATLTESAIFHLDPDQANVGHFIGEGLFFASVYFMCLASLTYTFPMLQTKAYDNFWESIFDKTPIQYQERFFTATGILALYSYNVFLLLMKVNSTDFMDQTVVDRLLLADLFMPWFCLSRADIFIEGFYMLLPAFEFSEAYGGLMVFIVIHYGFIGAWIGFVGSLSTEILVVLLGFYFLFMIVPKLFFLYRFRLVPVEPLKPDILSFSIPVRRAMYDGADVVMKKVKLNEIKVGSVGLKNYVIALSGGLPSPMQSYVVSSGTENDLSTEVLVSRRLKTFEGIFALTSAIILYALVLPLLFFVRRTEIKYYRGMNVLSEYKPDKEYNIWVSPPTGRSVVDALTNQDTHRVLVVADGPGMEASFTYFFKYFSQYKQLEEAGEDLSNKKIFFLWKCHSFPDVMVVVKFLRSFSGRFDWDGGEKEGINFLILCELNQEKMWAVTDLIENTYASFIEAKMLNQAANVNDMKVEKIFGEESGEENTCIFSIGSASLVPGAKALSKKVGGSFYDVIYERTMTTKTCWEPNGFFQVY